MMRRWAWALVLAGAVLALWALGTPAPPARYRPRVEAWSRLTDTERQIVTMIARQGASNWQISRAMDLSVTEIKHRLTQIYGRVNIVGDTACKRIRLIRWAWDRPEWRAYAGETSAVPLSPLYLGGWEERVDVRA